MLALGEAVPAEEEQPDESGFKEEGHQTFDGERSAEDVADVVRVVGPVRAELELHGDAGRHAEGKVDAEELAPELRHVLVNLLPREYVGSFHDDEQEGKSQRKRDEEKVIHRGERKLQPRKIDKIGGDHESFS